MAKFDIANAEIINKDLDILKIDYTTETGRGHFEVKMYIFFPAAPAKFKLIIDMVNKAENPRATAEAIYNYCNKCIEYLANLRDRIGTATDNDKKDHNALTSEIGKYTRNLEALAKYYNFEVKKDPEKITTKKITVVGMENDNGSPRVVALDGIRFEKFGKIFHAYKEPGKYGTTYVLVPSCGVACVKYRGPVKEAPAHVTPEVVAMISKIDLKAINKQFKETCATAENIVLNDDIKAIFEAPETTEETPAAVATSEATETATPEAVKPEEATATPEEETRETDTNGTKSDHTPKETNSHTAALTDTGTIATPSEFATIPKARKPRPPYYVATASKDSGRLPHGNEYGHFMPLYNPGHIITPRIPCDALKGFISRHKGRNVAPPGLYHCGSFLEEITARNTGPPHGNKLILYNTS